MSSTGAITEFLNELNETDSLAALREAYNCNAPLIFKLDTQPQPLRASIGSFSDKRIIIFPENDKIVLPLDKEVSIKFNVGTEVYFLKTTFKSHLNRYYIEMNSKVIQLKRRKEPRLLIPKNWAQQAAIIRNTAGDDLIKCKVADISLSGIRLEVLDAFPNYKRNDIIKIKFQIHKRAEVVTPAIVRFVLARTNMSSLLGLEFLNTTDVQKERISSLVGDIQLFNTTVKQ